MGFLSRRRGRRLRVIALVCFGMLVATLFTLGPSALARTPSAALTSSVPQESQKTQKPQESQKSAGPPARWRTRRPSGGRSGSRCWPTPAAWPPIRPTISGWPTPATTASWSTPRPGACSPTFGKNLDPPAGIATDATGHVWVADTGHDRVVEFSPVGRMLAIFGSPGSGRGQLDQPVALAVTPFGDVWVADQGNSRVEEFSASGRYRTSFAVPTPAGVGLDTRGDVWVSSPAYAPGNSVREFSPDRASVAVVRHHPGGLR